MDDPRARADRRLPIPPGFGRLLAVALLVVSLLGLLGRWNAWADLANQFAPIWLAITLLAILAQIAAGSGRLRSATTLMLLAAATLQGILTLPELARGASPFPPATSRAIALTIMTFNVWNESPDRPREVDSIVRSGADIVTLQEALSVDRMRSPKLAAAYPYRATCDDWWHCEILILSRRPIIAHGFTAPSPSGPGGPLWAVWIVTRAPDGRPVTILSTHLAWPVPPGLRERQARQLVSLVNRFDKGSLVITGDYNATGTSFSLRRQDDALGTITRRTQALFSWPAAINGLGWPAPMPFLGIDHIYAGPTWRTIEIERLPRSGSDHYPILARLSRGTA
jgi:endonuclease/exonuclease/phosphatase (EEP) superfamily protein YafD